MEMECTAFGKIGIETGSKEEVEVFEEQIKLAKKLDKPCIIHTPKKNEATIFEKVVKIPEKHEFPEDLTVIDHTTHEIVKKWKKDILLD